MAESIKTTTAKFLFACLVIALLGAFPAYLMAGDECEIEFTPIPEANPDSIKPLIQGSFVEVALEAPDGQRIIQPGFLVNDDGEIITRRSTYINAIKKAITGLNDDTLEVITTISEDALADIIVLKIEEPDQDVEPLEPRFFFPDNEEILAVIGEPYSEQNQARTAKVKTHGTDPLYGYITKLYDTPHDSLGGKMAVNYEGRMMGIIRSYKQDSLYANYLFPLSVVHIDGDHRGSEYFITKFSSGLSDSAQQDLFEAVQYFWSDDFEQARDQITDLILNYPSNPMVLLYSAYCDLYNGDLNEAIGKADEAMQLGHQVAELYYLKSLCYELMLKPKKAMIEIDSAIELNETFMDARALRGSLHSIMGNYEKGKDDIDYIQDHREDNPFCLAFKGLMELFELEKEKACRLFNRALERSRSDPRIYYYLTAYYAFENDDEKIEKALRKAIEIIPDQGEPYYYLANYFKAEDENDSAIVYYKMAAENSPYLLSASYALGRIYYDEKMYEEAIEYFEKVEDYYPDDLVLLRNLGACYAELEKFDHALMTFKKALKVDSKSQITHYNLGLVYLNKDMHKFAEAHFDTAYALGYRNRNLFFQQGRLYLEQGDTAKAKENYEKLRSISGATATKLHNLIIGRDDYVIDSTMDKRLQILIDDAKKSLVKVEGGLAFSRFFRVNYGLLFVFSPLEHKWGCVVNDRGDIILQKNAVNGSYGHVYYTGIDTSKLEIPEDSEDAAEVFKASEDSNEPETPPEVDKSLTNAIADEFVVFSVKDKDTLALPAKIPNDYPEKGDSVIVFTDPIWEHSDFC
ncbi:MAG: tetratricopeptide repeat protein, partial [candidate division Zixibacteria bacterium]|nr:tetratricopeptide repeat protein [candidate division Zixibacteria bacterium]